MERAAIKKRYAVLLIVIVGGAVIWYVLVRCFAADEVAAATVLLVLATVYLAHHAAEEAEATKMFMFAQSALSLFGELEKRDSRNDRRRVYQEVINLDAEQVADDPDIGGAAERVAGSFDYLDRLANVDQRLRNLAIEFYGVPAVKCWAIIKPYVTYMVDSGRRNPSFHEAFRNFAETAARDPRVGDQPRTRGAHRCWRAANEGALHLELNAKAHPNA